MAQEEIMYNYVYSKGEVESFERCCLCTPLRMNDFHSRIQSKNRSCDELK